MREISAAATENFRTHATFPSRGIPGTFVHASEEVTWLDSGLDTDTFNIVLGARLRPPRVEPVLGQIVAHFRSVGRPFSWWVCPGDRPDDLGGRLAAGGLVPEEWEVAMACDLGRGLLEPPPVPGTGFTRVTSRAALGEFARINAENWTPPDALVEAYYARAADRLLETDAPLRFYLARREGRFVAAVEIAVGAGALGVYNLSTRREHRNAGIGGALLTAALRDAERETGASIAVLQAAPFASGLYRRLGFSEFGRIAEFKPVRNVR